MHSGYLSLLADESLSIWGEGRPDAALRQIAARARPLMAFSKEVQARQEDFNEDQRDQLNLMKIPPPPPLAVRTGRRTAERSGGIERRKQQSLTALLEKRQNHRVLWGHAQGSN